MKRLGILVLLALASPPAALARGKFDPTTEFEQHEWIPIHLGPLNLSITKAVAYLMLGTVLTILLGISLMRVKRPGRRQALGEQVYELTQTQIAEQGLPSKAIGRWFPYVATLFLFIWVVNMLGFLPLPLTGEKWHGVPTWGIYAATSSLSVTLALALLTFVFTHYEGIRWNGPVRYFKSWIPEAPKPLLLLIVPLEILGQFMRLISLSVHRPHVHSPDPVPGACRDFRIGFLHLRGRDRSHDPGVHLRRSVRHLHRLGHRAGTLGGTTCIPFSPLPRAT